MTTMATRNSPTSVPPRAAHARTRPLPTTRRTGLGWALAIVLGSAAPLSAAEPGELLMRDDFSAGLAGWTFTDAQAWGLVESPTGPVLALQKASQYKPRFRSPYNLALREGLALGDFELTARLKTTTKSYGHRDLCVFFGYQDPDHFYYVHLGEKADDHANQIFIVNAAPRKKISLTSTAGTPWNDEWHTVRLRRELASGRIEVFFDDLENPVMTAEDTTFGAGQFGLGSFDDTGWFDDVEVRGAAAPATGP